MFNPKLRAIIKREYFQQVKNKAFWISTILIPVLGLFFIFIQVLLGKSMVSTGKIAVVDLTGRLYDELVLEAKAEEADRKAPRSVEKAITEEMSKPPIEKQAKQLNSKLTLMKVEATPETLAAVRKKLNEDVQKERIKAYVVLDARTLETGYGEWRAQSVKSEFVTRENLARQIGRVATKERIKDRGVDPALYDEALLRVRLEPFEASDKPTTEDSKDVGFNLAVSGIMFFLIYISIFVYGAMIMRGVLEEKNNRIIEVIVSSVRPTDLMLGKIIGIGLVGLTQYGLWGLVALNLSIPGVVGTMGMGSGEGLPPIPALTIGAFVVFFILGYFLYASLYAALAAPFNTEQEAQQFVMIPAMFLVFTSLMFIFVFNQPNGTLAQVLSFFPFTSPLIMFMRISVQPPAAWEIAASIVILVGTIWLVAYVAGRIYRVGILMYGKKPTLPEIVRWAMQAD